MQEYKEITKENGDWIRIPVYTDDMDVEWYPMSYINQKVLGRIKLTGSKLTKSYGEYLKKIELYYADQNYPQQASCLNIDGFKLWLSNVKIGRLNKEQRIEYNKLCDMVGYNNHTSEKEIIVNDVNRENYTEFERKCIDNLNVEFEYKLCINCKKYYPNTKEFYYNKGNICRKCQDKHFKTCNPVGDKITTWFGEDAYMDYLKMDLVDFSVKYRYIKQLANKEYELKYLINCHKICLIDDYSVSGISKFLRDNMMPKNTTYSMFNNGKDILMSIRDDLKVAPWMHNGVRASSIDMTDDEIRDAFWLYIDEMKIDKNDVYDIDYYEILKESKLSNKKLQSDSLYSAMMLTKFKYPAYKFNISSVNYWKNKENRVVALKYLIEKDLSYSKFDRLPLYLTKKNIKLISNTMSTVLSNYYKNELFYWVDECYPNIFDHSDFNIWWSRDEFDSMEEQTVHEILKDNFGSNLIYNNGDNRTRIKSCGHQPDWYVITDGKPILIEYFGMYNQNNIKSLRVKEYVKRTDKKMEDYKTLSHYDTLYIFPEDLKDNYKGLYKKLNKY